MPAKAHLIANALHHLESALAELDRADEVEAPPYVQMAIDLLLEQRADTEVPSRDMSG